MFEIALIFVGVAIALYVSIGLLDQVIKLFRQVVLKESPNLSDSDSQNSEASIRDRLATASEGFPANFDLGSAQCHADVCPTASETVSGLAEGLQGALEGSGEHLGQWIESVSHAVSHTGS
ncbi:hypothetical protein H6G89_15790 [Oscillatoria sp. FACHB-1407]|uniref:hypothetical protein n=1 Tax=Oscillatoria sp. FACHB-1407 TaxID=2692847 RepID=UPI001682F2F0|nr:hypothetical protein [Oscillatoria sp. FACHB-1407]MBD2462508.1 hypothetical protein [Oscillatoria sp. FACHB-1407]